MWLTGTNFTYYKNDQTSATFSPTWLPRHPNNNGNENVITSKNKQDLLTPKLYDYDRSVIFKVLEIIKVAFLSMS